LEPGDRNQSYIRDFTAPIPVVEFFGQDTGRIKPGGKHIKVATSYRYGGAKLDAHGRGFLGFAEVHATNANTGINTANFHKQSFPFTGMVWKSEQQLPLDGAPDDLDTETLRAHFFPGARDCDEDDVQLKDECSEPQFAAPANAITADVRIASRTIAEFEKRDLGVSWQVFAEKTTENSYDIATGK